MGKQIEVTAWSGQSIPASSRRFFCPECMESVTLDVRGHFRHKKRTTQSIECEKRVDSPTRTSYERMGLPICIKNEATNIFHLYIGFPGLPANILNEAAKNEATIAISNGITNRNKYRISSERFETDHFTYIPVNFLPANKGRYKIEYYNTPSIIKNRWTNSSDIWGYGQFFKIGEIFSRKIRPLGTIVTDQNYYFIGNNLYFQQYNDFVEIHKVGLLQTANEKLSIYKINIHSTKAKEHDFKNLSATLMEKYHLSLLIGESQISPLWPPCIIDDNYLIFPAKAKKSLFVVDSPNNPPIVYKYQGNSCSPIPLSEHSPYFFNLDITEAEIPLSVDKVFNGNIQYIRKQELNLNLDDIEVDIYNENGNSIIENPPFSLNNKEFLVKCSCSCTVFLLKSDGSELVFKLNSKNGVTVKSIKWNDTIILLSNAGRQLFSYTFKRPLQPDISVDTALIKKIKSAKGPVIPINANIIALYRKTTMYPSLQQEITKYIRTGRIPIYVVTLLNNIFGGK